MNIAMASLDFAWRPPASLRKKGQTMKNLSIGILLGLLCNMAAAEDYDFFAGARYPGPVKKPGVDVYQVKQAGGTDAKGYERREVGWWPRKGVAVIEVKKAMPLRTWTLVDRKMDPAASTIDPILGIEELTRRLSWKQPRQFKAHLIGFRGIGNSYGNPFGVPRDYYCPAVVLRLEDGTKRCFLRGTFVADDEKYILALYQKAMQRMRAGLSKAKYEVRGGVPNSAKPGEPGTMWVESEHFVWFSGSQAPPGESNPWVDVNRPEETRLYREGSVEFAENMWAYQEHAGVLMPFWDRPQQNKYRITVCGTYRDGHVYIAGYAGGGYGGCGIKDAGGGPWSLGLAHEWGHGVPLQSRVDGGGGEILADACQVVDDPARTEKFRNNVLCPWRNCMHASYGTGLFYAIMGDDPNWGYCMVITLPIGREEVSIFHTLARLGEQRGLFANGIRGVGDMMGEFAARQAEFDCELQDSLRRGFLSVKRNYLEAVDRKAGLYRIPWAEAPEPFGANIVRLMPEKDAEMIAVDFRGFYDPDTYSDWRACIVAVDAQGKTRYSPLWNKGVMEMKMEPGDRRFWMTVAGTPYALPRIPGRGGGVGRLLSGRHAYRYPYEVKLSGCRPGTPHNMPGDTDDYELAHINGFRDRTGVGLCVIPHPGDTPEAEILRKTVPALRLRLEKFKQETDRLIADGKISTGNWWYYRRFEPHLSFLDEYTTWMLDGIEGHRHPNGGGWVAGSAEVAPSAYVAPDAVVLNGAKVLGRAAIEDCAVVRGPGAVVSGHAKVGGQAYVAGKVKIDGYTRVLHPIVAKDEQVAPNEVPLRQNQGPAEGGKLWANYACDREEKEVLEDWFRYKQPGHPRAFYLINLNGHLHGRPQFIVDGQRRGFRFDGCTQYAEAASNLADLGQITVDVALKWEGGKGQTVFDFGTSPDNRFTLSPQGASGRAELAITLAGKTEVIAADAAAPQGKWSQLRVEIDGQKIALWIDGRKAVQKASRFRPADVYPGGAEKRNFIAATRDASGHFKGSLDYLRVYHTVYEDFTKAPEPRQHSSRRVSLEFVDSAKMRYSGGNRLVEDLVKAKIALDYGSYYQEIGKKMGDRKREIENSHCPLVEEKTRKLQEIERKLRQRKQELVAEFDKLPETIKQREEGRKLEEKARTLQAERRKLAAALETKFKEQQKPPTAKEKARIAANEKILAEAKARKEEAKAQVEKLEASFKARPEIARLQAQIDDLTSRSETRNREILDRPELKQKPTRADELRALKENDRDLQMWTTQLPRLKAQLEFNLAELRVNTPEYVRWWRLSVAGPPRLLSDAETNGGPNVHSLIANDPQIAKLDRQIARCQTDARELRPDSRGYVAKKTAQLDRQVAKAKMELGEARKKNFAKHGLEYNWLSSMGWQAFSRFYNKPFSSYMDDLAREAVGREDQECHEEFGSLESIYRLQTETQWHTQCDWDWRLKQEIDGSIKELPLLQKWLKRARGTTNE